MTDTLGRLQLPVPLDADLRLLRVPLVQLNVRLDTSLAAFAAGKTSLTVGTTLLGADLGLLTGVVSALVASLVRGLPAVLTSTLAMGLTSLVSSLGTTLVAIVAPMLTAVGGVVGALPRLLSVRVNVQTDSGAGRDGTMADTGSWSVTALRVGLGEAVRPDGLAHLDLATSVVGPNSVDLAGGTST